MSVPRAGLRLKLLISLSFSILFSFSVLAHDWQEYKPGGETRCGRGEEFSFFVHHGSSDKVIVDFIGGGACWNGKNCSVAGSTFVDSVDVVRGYQEEGLEGIYDHSDSRNPVKDWTHVIVPYCTGDIHWGENDQTYTDEEGEEFTIYHRGATNTKAVLSWLEENIQSPEKVLVTGCSAGSYGSIYWTPHIRRLFPEARMTQFGDSGTGVITEDFQQTSLQNWNSTLNAPSWIPGLDPQQANWREMSLNDYYEEVARSYPEIPLNQFSYSEDETQMFFHEIMGGDSETWPSDSADRLNSLKDKLRSFDRMIVQGSEHCVLPYERLHTDTDLEGRSFKEWFKRLL